MKRVLAVLLIAAMLFCSVQSVWAESDSEESTSAEDNNAVTSLDDLLLAIETANNGDIITLANTIYISPDNSVIIGDELKTVTLQPASDFSGESLLYINCFPNTDIALQNLTLDGTNQKIYAIDSQWLFDSKENINITFDECTFTNFNMTAVCLYFGVVEIVDCIFDSNYSHINTAHLSIKEDANVSIIGTDFINGKTSGSCGALRNTGNVTINNCKFKNNIAGYESRTNQPAGAICNETNGVCQITDTIITNNQAQCGGGIVNHSTTVVEITDSLITDNVATAFANDLFGIFSVTYTDEFDWNDRIPLGWYNDTMDNRFNSESNLTTCYGLELDGTANGKYRFVYEDEIPVVEEPSPSPDDDTTDETNPPIDDDQSPETEEDTTDTTPEGDIPPEPTDKDNDGGFNFDPYWFYLLFLKNQQSKEEPTTPELEPEIVDNTRQELRCNEAVLDPNKFSELHGYEDGSIHPDNPVTRAEIAELIYRSLTDESKAVLQGAENIFTDILPDAWYLNQANALAAAGVFIGYGEGIFGGNDNITWEQILTLLCRFVEPQECEIKHIDCADWVLSGIQTAVYHGWIEDSIEFDGTEYITRVELVGLLNTIFESYR